MGSYVAFFPNGDSSIRILDIPVGSCLWMTNGSGGRLLIQILNDENECKIPNLLRWFVRVCGSVETFVLNDTGYRFGDGQKIEIIETNGQLFLDVLSREVWDISVRHH